MQATKLKAMPYTLSFIDPYFYNNGTSTECCDKGSLNYYLPVHFRLFVAYILLTRTCF